MEIWRPLNRGKKSCQSAQLETDRRGSAALLSEKFKFCPGLKSNNNQQKWSLDSNVEHRVAKHCKHPQLFTSCHSVSGAPLVVWTISLLRVRVFACVCATAHFPRRQPSIQASSREEKAGHFLRPASWHRVNGFTTTHAHSLDLLIRRFQQL